MTFGQQKMLFGGNQPERKVPSTRIVETTDFETANRTYKKNWLKHRKDKSVHLGSLWIFTDGSSTGWHAAVIVRPDVNIQRVARFTAPTETRNVGAELNAFLLGLERCPSDLGPVIVVHDYLGVGAWFQGAWQIKSHEVEEKVALARQIAKKFSAVSFIHHAGHQTDKSDFTRFNVEADELCNEQVEKDEVSSWL